MNLNDQLKKLSIIKIIKISMTDPIIIIENVDYIITTQILVGSVEYLNTMLRVIKPYLKEGNE